MLDLPARHSPSEGGGLEQADVAIVGGGAAGIFAAICYAEKQPGRSICVLEKSSNLLSKVKISGGGRCNVTHACFDPHELVRSYPRGHKELLGAFHRFQPEDTVRWFARRNVKLKTEEDGRMFPVTDRSQTIIDCFETELRNHQVHIRYRADVKEVTPTGDGFNLRLADGVHIRCRQLLIAAGGHPTTSSYDYITRLGHSLHAPVPSLFTFNLPGDPILELQGVSSMVHIELMDAPFTSSGPLLITHWGMSGPAVLKLSAWAARYLHEKNYTFSFRIDWLPGTDAKELEAYVQTLFQHAGGRNAGQALELDLPKKLKHHLLLKAGIDPERRWAEIGKKQKLSLLHLLKSDTYTSKGKTTFKQEFVQCGGVALNEIDMTRMESKVVPGLYFAGEVLDIDAVTGGFNFQAAWTTAWIAAESMASDA